MKRTVRVLVATAVTSIASFAGVAAFAAPAAHASGSSLVTANPCPSGYQGVTIGVDSHNVQACENIVP